MTEQPDQPRKLQAGLADLRFCLTTSRLRLAAAAQPALRECFLAISVAAVAPASAGLAAVPEAVCAIAVLGTPTEIAMAMIAYSNRRPGSDGLVNG